jgi:hypothetical protein
MDLTGLYAYLDDLETEIGESCRPAAQAAAQVFYNLAKQNVNRIGKKTGNLAGSIYQKYSKENSEDGKIAWYNVSWNVHTGKQITRAPHGHLVEYGHIQKYRQILLTKGPKKGQWVTLRSHPITPIQVGARPFMRPAYTNGLNAAVAAVESVIYERMAGIK